MQTLSPRSRPTIHIHPDTLQGGGFHFPHESRKRKRSSNYSSEDDDAVVSTSQHSSSSPRKAALPTIGSLSPARSPTREYEDEETDHRHHKRVKKAIARMDELSLYGQSSIPYQFPHPHLVSPAVSNDSGTSYAGSLTRDAPIFHHGVGGGGYINSHGVEGPELLEVDEAFMPRDHGHEYGHEHDDLDAHERIIVPEIEESPLSPTSFTSALNHAPRHHSKASTSEPDVKMGGTSWYEPEKDRIVITDLDDSDIENDTNSPITPAEATLTGGDMLDADQDGGTSPFTAFKVSPAYLARFSKPIKAPEIPPAPSTLIENAGSECRSLVLYRPQLPVYKAISQRLSGDEETHANSVTFHSLSCSGSSGSGAPLPEQEDVMDLDD